MFSRDLKLWQEGNRIPHYRMTCKQCKVEPVAAPVVDSGASEDDPQAADVTADAPQVTCTLVTYPPVYLRSADCDVTVWS